VDVAVDPAGRVVVAEEPLEAVLPSDGAVEEAPEPEPEPETVIPGNPVVSAHSWFMLSTADWASETTVGSESSPTAQLMQDSMLLAVGALQIQLTDVQLFNALLMELHWVLH